VEFEKTESFFTDITVAENPATAASRFQSSARIGFAASSRGAVNGQSGLQAAGSQRREPIIHLLRLPLDRHMAKAKYDRR
jgi:hypothetical protein